MTQSRSVARALEEHHPGIRVELVEIRTSGDRIQDVPLAPHLGQSFFTKEIQDALLDGRVDLAVHSCKDLATELPAGTHLCAIPVREDCRDALISGGPGLTDLPAGARVGTSSPRRKAFLRAVRPDLELTELRGNVPTRLKAVDDGRCDAVILAAAGLRRLGLGSRITEPLPTGIMLPAASQGALALETRADDERAREIVSVLDDPVCRSEVTAERACLRRLEAGCQAPVGALGRHHDGVLHLRAAVEGPDGLVWAEVSGESSEAEALGARAANELLAALGLESLRNASWAGPPPRRLGAP
ncbi:MAG: hydroxymethylbilane synthase [Gemmatimonadales bacterium]|nr:MAG: hydroxymethylbilane synthase [Gemmatimonadales bacterium]